MRTSNGKMCGWRPNGLQVVVIIAIVHLCADQFNFPFNGLASILSSFVHIAFHSRDSLPESLLSIYSRICPTPTSSCNFHKSSEKHQPPNCMRRRASMRYCMQTQKEKKTDKQIKYHNNKTNKQQNNPTIIESVRKCGKMFIFCVYLFHITCIALGNMDGRQSE